MRLAGYVVLAAVISALVSSYHVRGYIVYRSNLGQLRYVRRFNADLHFSILDLPSEANVYLIPAISV